MRAASASFAGSEPPSCSATGCSRGIEAEQARAVAMDHRIRYHHFGVKQRTARQLPMKEPTVPIGPIHHRRNGQAILVIFTHFLFAVSIFYARQVHTERPRIGQFHEALQARGEFKSATKDAMSTRHFYGRMTPAPAQGQPRQEKIGAKFSAQLPRGLSGRWCTTRYHGAPLRSANSLDTSARLAAIPPSSFA